MESGAPQPSGLTPSLAFHDHGCMCGGGGVVFLHRKHMVFGQCCRSVGQIVSGMCVALLGELQQHMLSACTLATLYWWLVLDLGSVGVVV